MRQNSCERRLPSHKFVCSCQVMSACIHQGYGGRVLCVPNEEAHHIDGVAVEIVGQVDVTNSKRGVQNVRYIGQQVHGVN